MKHEPPAPAGWRHLGWLALGVGLAALTPAGPARAAGAVFAPAPDTARLRSVLAAFDVGPDALGLAVAVELTGTATRAAWVLPLAAAPLTPPEAEAADALDAREAATAWQVTLPLPEGCPAPGPSGGGTGCGCGDPPPPASAPALAHPERPAAILPETLRGPSRAEVGELTVLTASGASLVNRLRDRGYFVSTAQAEALGAAVLRPGPVLWLEVSGDPGARRLPVVRLRLPPETQAILPAALSAGSVADRLDLRVLITADGPFLSDTWVGVTPRAEEVLHDMDGRTSYDAWVTRACGAGAGHVFSLEAVWPEADGRITTRLYARPAAEQLDKDPAFRPHPQASLRIQPVLDLSSAPSVLVCDAVEETRRPSPCAFTYCGPSSECLVVDARASCRCPDGAAGAVVEGADGAPAVGCVALEVPGAPGPAEPPGVPDPCVNLDCGAGACLTTGGQPRCACTPGAAAQLGPRGLRCVPTDADAPTFGPGAGVESRGAALVRAARMGSAPVFALVVLLLWSRRRRASM